MQAKILILTASIGAGHIKAAEAIAAELKKLNTDSQITTIDFMSHKISVINYLLKEIYLKMLALVPNIYDVCYKFSSGGETGNMTKTAFSVIMQPALRKILKTAAPDIVVCTHPFPEGAINLYKKYNAMSAPLVAVLTDYSVHQIWLYPRVDKYFVAIEPMKEEMVRRGYSQSLCIAAGIPVAGGLANLPAKNILRQKYNIAPSSCVLMLMGGGLGLGDISSTLDELDELEEKLTLIVIAGHNDKLKQAADKFAARSHHKLLVFGYTDKARELMKSADLLITKPGALTISEAFTLGVPLLLHDPIPGPETENAIYATKRGAAVWLHPGEKLKNAVVELLAGDKLLAMKKNALKCARPQAACDIAVGIMKLLFLSIGTKV